MAAARHSRPRSRASGGTVAKRLPPRQSRDTSGRAVLASAGQRRNRSSRSESFAWAAPESARTERRQAVGPTCPPFRRRRLQQGGEYCLQIMFGFAHERLVLSGRSLIGATMVSSRGATLFGALPLVSFCRIGGVLRRLLPRPLGHSYQGGQYGRAGNHGSRR